MLIEQEELLLAWIREQVVLICDAEPTAFAKYVLALLRKTSTENDGRQLCNTQLEVFLQTNTVSFVDKLFSVLREKSYLQQDQPEPTREPSPVLELIDISPQKEEVRPDVKQPEEEPSQNIQQNHQQLVPGEESDKHEVAALKSSRPRIQPPEKRPEEEEQAEENLLKAQRLIQMSTNSKRRSIVGLNRVGGNLLRPATRRYMVREDQRSSKSWSRSRSPIRESRTSDIKDIFVGGKHRRCRNYEVLGYCLRGNQCPFRHETTPITVTAPPGESYGVNNYSGLTNQAYNPEAPALNPMAGPGLPHYNPVVGNGGGGQPPRRQLTNSVLVKRIPPEFNHIYNINEHFSQFGEIKNIQLRCSEMWKPQANEKVELMFSTRIGSKSVAITPNFNKSNSFVGDSSRNADQMKWVHDPVSFENSPDTALITYKHASSATNAFKSKKAIFDNRFVYLMYYTPPQQQPQDQTGSQWTNDAHQQQPIVDVPTKQKSMPPRHASDYAKVFSSGNDPETTASESLQTRRSRLRTGQPAKNLQPINVENSQQNLKQETMLKLKTELYLKISEQLQLVLRQAQMSDARARRAVMDKVAQLQKNLAEIRNDLLGLHNKVNGQKQRIET